MVEFTKIRIEGDWIYADAYDYSERRTVRINHKSGDVFLGEPNMTIEKACYNLILAYRKGRVKESTYTVAWY